MTQSTESTVQRSGFRDLSFEAKLGWAVALLFAFLSAIWVWTGIADLFQAIATFGFDLTGLAWLVYLGSIAAPIVTYALAFFISRRMPAWARIAVFLVGLAVAMVVKTDLWHLILSRV